MKIRQSLAAVLLMAFVVPAMAFGGDHSADADSRAMGKAEGNTTTVNGDTVHSDVPRQAPAIAAPGLTTTLSETCMGSTSAGGSGPGFGLTIGSTWRDVECVRRLNARELRAMGYPTAGKELMCDNDDVRAAFERVAKMTGNADLLCQATADAKEAQAEAEGTQPSLTTYNEQINQNMVTFEDNRPVVNSRSRDEDGFEWPNYAEDGG